MRKPPNPTRRRSIETVVVGPFLARSIVASAALQAVQGLAAVVAADGSPDARFDPARYKGRIVYLDFWASWCPPCLQSFAWMQRLAERHASSAFSIVAVNLDRDRAAATRFLDKVKPGFDIAFDPRGELARGFKVAAMPSSFLLDADGVVVHRHEGFKVADQSDLESRVAALLGKRR